MNLTRYIQTTLSSHTLDMLSFVFQVAQLMCNFYFQIMFFSGISSISFNCRQIVFFVKNGV